MSERPWTDELPEDVTLMQNLRELLAGCQGFDTTIRLYGGEISIDQSGGYPDFAVTVAPVRIRMAPDVPEALREALIALKAAREAARHTGPLGG